MTIYGVKCKETWREEEKWRWYTDGAGVVFHTEHLCVARAMIEAHGEDNYRIEPMPTVRPPILHFYSDEESEGG